MTHINIEGSFKSPPVERPTIRREVLTTAGQLIHGDRNAEYGEPADNFGQTAALWAAYMGVTFSRADVANMMILAKVSRLAKSPDKLDSWVDIAGYAACGAEVASKEA